MIEMILAMNLNGTIGDANKLVWNAPNDMKWFHKQIQNKQLIAGRKTFNNLPLKLKWQTLPMTSGSTMFDFILEENKDVMIIGGGEIYRLFLPYADKIYLSIIPQIYYGDTTFEIDWKDWNVTYSKGYDDALCMILEPTEIR